MARTDGYCEVSDLKITGTRLPQGIQVTPEQVIFDAADEIDAAIGVLYVTPIVANESDPDQRQDALVLKRINAILATGRLITTMSAGGETSRVHAYGEYLLRFAYRLIEEIKTGVVVLTSADKHPQPGSNPLYKGPILVQDNQIGSLVDGFYQNFVPDGFAPGRQTATNDPWPNENYRGYL